MAAHAVLIASLVGEAKAHLGQLLDALPGETDPFRVATAFLEAKHRLVRLESLVDAINDCRFAPILTGAIRGQVDQAQPIEARQPQDPEEQPQDRRGEG